MSITCQLCCQIFEKQINNKHLKYKHSMTTVDYKNQFGETSLSSPEYRLEKSAANKGANNPNFGNAMSIEAKISISNKNKGKIPYNKGLKIIDELQLTNIREGVVKREKSYIEHKNHPRLGTSVSDESKNKISVGVMAYAENHADEIKLRAQKILQTKTDNNYFDQLKEITFDKYKKIWKVAGYNIIDIGLNQIQLTHLDCNSITNRNFKSEVNEFICSTCFEKKSISDQELELRDWIRSNLDCDLIFQDKSILTNFEIDILIPSLNLGIEYNGIYHHRGKPPDNEPPSDIEKEIEFEKFSKNKWYHRKKQIECEKKGITLIQIFEDEWIHKTSIVKSRLLHIFKKSNLIMKEKVSARKCYVNKLSIKEARTWHTAHHIQGYGNGHECYGLFYNTDLVAVMDFSKLTISKGRMPKDNHWELSRYSVEGNIPGAAGKLFAHFIKDKSPDEVISYSDCRWGKGNVYKLLNFVHKGVTLPGYWYVKGNMRYHRYKFRKSELIRLGFDNGTDKKNTEYRIMRNLKYHIIWDCGNDYWVWSKKEGI